MKIKSLSTAQRLALQFSLLIAGIVIILSVVFVLFLRLYIRNGQKRELIKASDQMKIRLEARNDNLGNFFQRKMDHRDMPPAPQRMMPMLDRPQRKGNIPYYISFSVYEADTKNVIFSNDPFLPILPETKGRCFRYKEKNYYADGDLDLLYRAVTLKKGAFNYIIQTSMSLDRDTSENLLRSFPIVLLVLLIPFLFISFFAALIITQYTMGYVKEITATAEKIGSENLDERLPVKGRGDELDKLAKTFNDLFARLKSDFDRERRFTSDVSHELKTPLAVILGHANLIRRWGKNDPKQLEQSLVMLITEVHSMESIINNLLHISRLENGKIEIVKNKEKIFPLFIRLKKDTEVWSPAAVFEINSSKSITAFFDSELLYQAFTIVISNSIKFADKALIIKLDVFEESDFVKICIIDNGPGIDKSVLPHVFERFYRGDPSHNRNKGGSGLGLSIVKVIIEVMGGSVFAESDKNKGTSIIFLLPKESS